MVRHFGFVPKSADHIHQGTYATKPQAQSKIATCSFVGGETTASQSMSNHYQQEIIEKLYMIIIIMMMMMMMMITL